MNKINIQEITDLIASQSGQTKKFSEQFLRELVDVIGEYLQKDGIVKVKGLGTFKVIRVEERKSVDVATGNEIILPSHNKVQFIPEEGVKQRVNAPYAHLSTTTDEVNMPSDDKIQGEALKEELKEREKIEESEEREGKEDEGVKPLETETSNENECDGELGKRKGINPWWIVLIVINILLIAILCTSQYWKPYTDKWFAEEDEEFYPVAVAVDESAYEDVKTYEEPVAEDTVAVMADSTLIAYQDSVSQAETQQKFDIRSYTRKMAAEAPVREVVTVIDGSRLTMVAYRAYGSKDFWVYVYDANRDVLRSPSGVNKGMELKIADLPPELTDPDSPEALEFARELAQKY